MKKVLCMSFDANEELLVAGLESGSVALWDLTKKKLLRCFQKAHQAKVTCIDFHPFGDYFATGSADNNVKVWDMSRKNCLQTYKGHTSTVISLRFTPDGRWLVSGDTKGEVKLWDLTAGKILTQFCSHKGAVTCLDFHPTEFLLATGSEDGSVQYFDLDTFQLASGTQKNPQTPISCVSFTPDGKYLLAISQSSLKVWSWEPDTLHDEIPLEWNGVCDFAINQGFKNGFGVAKHGDSLAAWCIILDKLAPYKEGYVNPPPEEKRPATPEDPSKPSTNEKSSRKSGKPRVRSEKRTASSRKSSSRNDDSSAAESSDSDSNLMIQNTTLETQKLLNHLRSSQFNMRSELRKAQRRKELEEKFRKRREAAAQKEVSKSSNPDNASERAKTPSPESIEKANHSPSSQRDSRSSSEKAPSTKSSGPPGLKKPFAQRKSQRTETDENGNVNYVVVPGKSSSSDRDDPRRSLERSLSDPNLNHNVDSSSMDDGGPALHRVAPPSSSGKKSRNIPSRSVPKSRRSTNTAPLSASNISGQILDGSKIMKHIISGRLVAIKLIARLWHEDFKQEAINHLSSLDDPAITVTVMEQLCKEQHANYFTLQMCKKLLNLQIALLDSRYEPYIRSGITTTEILHKRFFGIIKQSLHAPRLGRNSNSTPTDSRYHRCAKCRQLFLTLRGQLQRFRSRGDSIGQTAESLHIQLSHYQRL